MASSRYLRAHRDQFHRCCLSSSENWSQVDQLIAPPLGFPPTTGILALFLSGFSSPTPSLFSSLIVFFFFFLFLFSKLGKREKLLSSKFIVLIVWLLFPDSHPSFLFFEIRKYFIFPSSILFIFYPFRFLKFHSHSTLSVSKLSLLLSRDARFERLGNVVFCRCERGRGGGRENLDCTEDDEERGIIGRLRHRI